jgi:hypothetical protein
MNLRRATTPCPLALAVLVVGCAAPMTSSSRLKGAPPGSFASLASLIEPGDDVWVHVPDGQVNGTVVRISDRDLVVRRRGLEVTMACATIARVDRESVNRRGAMRGAVIAGLLAIVPGWNACGSNLGCWAGGLAVYGGLGALVGGSIGGRRTVYVATPGSCATPDVRGDGGDAGFRDVTVTIGLDTTQATPVRMPLHRSRDRATRPHVRTGPRSSALAHSPRHSQSHVTST